jgi:glucan biosynthesis protein C
MTQRNAHIETLRGLAVLMLVAYHVVGPTAATGLRVEDGHFLRWLDETLEFVRMPLFTFISGYVYALRPADLGSLRPFLRGKIRRLMIPLWVVGGAFFVLQAVMPNVNTHVRIEDIWRVPFFPFAHYWYLQALLLVFALVAALDALRVLQRPLGFTLVFVSATALVIARVVNTFFFSIDGAVYLLPFFLWGLGVSRFKSVLLSDRAMRVLVPIAVVTVVLRQLALHHVVSIEVERHDTLPIIAGFAATVVLVRIAWSNRHLAQLGRYSYGIYLLHVFVTAASRLALQRVGVHSLAALFIGGLLCGVGGPIILEEALDRSPLARMAIFGRRKPLRPTPAEARSAPPSLSASGQDGQLFLAHRPELVAISMGGQAQVSRHTAIPMRPPMLPPL